MKCVRSLLLVSALVVGVSACVKEKNTAEEEMGFVPASIAELGTKVSFSSNEDQLPLISRWESDDVVNAILLNDSYSYGADVHGEKVRQISSDGKKCMLSYPKLSGYAACVFMTHNCNPKIISNDIHYNASLFRAPIAKFKAPLASGVWSFSSGDEVFFRHYLTYEVLHVKNDTDAAISFSECDFNVQKPWFETRGGLKYSDGSFLPDSPAAEEPVSKSEAMTVPAHGTGIVISSYIPNGNKISDAQLVAQINGKEVKSSNKKSSDVELRTSRAYHMFVTWDGSSLEFEDDSNRSSIEISAESLNFGEVALGGAGNVYFTVTNTNMISSVPIAVSRTPSGGPFSVDGESQEFMLKPGETKPFRASFKPTAEGSFTGTVEIVEKAPSKNYTYTLPLSGTGYKLNLEAVDLGLSVKWASFNVGAKKPEEYGDYYAWGEVDTYYEPGYAQTSYLVWKSGKTMGYKWESYKWCDGSGTTLNKYNYDAGYGKVDGLRSLQLEDDAVNAKWGGNWQMPSEEDFMELVDKCTSEWTSRNGVNGMLFTSKINGNSIFLPAAGHFYSKGRSLEGDIGLYYASTIDEFFPSDACSLFFTSSTAHVGSDSRPQGCPLRPVYVENIRVTGVSLDSGREYMYVGDEVLLVATITPSHAYDKGIKWSSSNSSVAVVDNIGTMKAVGVGKAVITAKTNEGGYTASCEVSVSEYVAVTGISLNASRLDINPGESRTLTATVTPSNASRPSVKWSSSDSGIAEVGSYSGKVTGKSTGTAIVTATVTDGGLTATCEVTVEKVRVTGISLDKTKMTLNEGFSGFLKATVEPSNAYDNSFTWSSSNSSVATVDAEGLVSAVKNGTAVITAKTNDGGHTASCTVTVRKFPMPEAVDLGLSVKWASCNLGASSPEEYGDYYAWGEVEPYYYSGGDPQSPSQRWKPGKIYGYHYYSYTWANGTDDKHTKYCTDSDYGTVDGKTVLEPADDAAHVMLGGRWRMPTVDEFRELLNNCSYGKTQYNGVNGWLLTSNRNGKTIFLPAAGDRYITNIERVGAGISYLSSSLHPSYCDCAYCIINHDNFHSLIEVYYGPRCGGDSIRAVCD